MSKNLVIVESPAKAKTIEGYLGKDFTVKSSFGHIRDLPKDGLAIDIEKNFTPTYVISNDKKEIISELKKLVKSAETVYLASDDDREGEAISWHLKEALDLNDINTRRIVFREITKNAILNAIKNPRGIDINLVNAQQARRVLDRLVGYELSPILWKKVKTGLSAGRVQSVAVRLVVEREREIEQHHATSSFKLTAVFKVNNKFFKTELNKKFQTEVEAETFVLSCKEAEFIVENLETKPTKRTPPPPFTTSTLQQEAARKLNFPVAMTMQVAQRLYEEGRISYMRTDSVNLSNDALAAAKTAIESQYGKPFSHERRFKNKNESAQEAHEAIRPTDFTAQKISGENRMVKLYDLIWKRAIASQMSDAQLEKTTATISISNREEKWIAEGEVVKFEGFLKVYEESRDEEIEDTDEESTGKSTLLPPMHTMQKLGFESIKAKQIFSRPAARYTEASLVKKLEELGIGRPSTYAPTISTILKRNYIEKESRDGVERPYLEIILTTDSFDKKTKTETTGTEKNKLFPTNTAMVVNDFLTDHFDNVVDYKFTASVEQEFDDIAAGKKSWETMIREFYDPFHEKVQNSESIKRSDLNSTRVLGVEQNGETVSVKLGKYGAYVQIGEAEGEKKPRFANLRKGQLMESLTLDEALDLFNLPREVGELEGEKMQANIGKYGPYIRHAGKFYSLLPEQDPLSISEDEAVKLILDKREQDSTKYIKTFDEDDTVFVINGKFGPYIKFGQKNVKIPKGTIPEDLSYEQCKTLAAETPDKKVGGRRFPAKKKK